MACNWTTITETYWTVCWKWIFPYPCKKSRTLRRWCCDFSWIKETGWFFFSTLEGCSGGVEYNWTAFSFGIVGTHWYFNITKCFNSPLTASGKCGSTTGTSGTA